MRWGKDETCDKRSKQIIKASMEAGARLIICANAVSADAEEKVLEAARTLHKMLPLARRWRARVLQGGVQRVARLRAARLACNRVELLVQRSSECQLGDEQLAAAIGRLEHGESYTWSCARDETPSILAGRHHLLKGGVMTGVVLPTKLALLARWAGRLWRFRANVKRMLNIGGIVREPAIGDTDAKANKLASAVFDAEVTARHIDLRWRRARGQRVASDRRELWSRVYLCVLAREAVAAERALAEAGGLRGVMRERELEVADERRQERLQRRRTEKASAAAMSTWRKTGAMGARAAVAGGRQIVSDAHVHRVTERSKVETWLNGISKRRRELANRNARLKRERAAAIREGRQAGRNGLWRIAAILAVKRPPGRGRKLLIRVRWAGRWSDDWVNITELNGAAKKDARRMEARLFGSKAPLRPISAPTRIQPKRGGNSSASQDGDDPAPPRRRSLRRIIDDSESSDGESDEELQLPKHVARKRRLVVLDSDEESDFEI